MHEMSLMGGVFEAIEATLAHHNVKKVTLIKLKIGKLTNAEPDALQMAFEAYGKGTVCEGAELQIELLPVKGKCRKCSEEFMIPGLLFSCPKCQHFEIDIIQGEELLLESLEVEE